MPQDHIRIYEVGPRDGLQNEPHSVPSATKIELIKRLGMNGLKHIEATAFVSPKWVPQMADHNEIMRAISAFPASDIAYPVLVPNDKGMDAAIASGAKDIAVFTAASESFTQKNINASIAQSIERFVPVIEKAKSENISVRGYVSCIAGCPYEVEINPSAVAEVASTLYHMGCNEISLGDTIGTGTPNKISDVIKAVSDRVPVSALALHCHDTYGQALANIYAGLEQGITIIDSSVGGLGGCPYAKGASGNVATEDVVYMLEGMGINTGIDLDGLIETAWYICDQINRAPASKLAHAKKK